jgi:transposase
MPTFEEMQREALAQAIRSQGSIASAAVHLGVSRSTAFRMVKRFKLREADLTYVIAPEPEIAVAPEPTQVPRAEPVQAPPAPKPYVDPLFANWRP